jgi:superoxide dismutase, Cu-Zn family
MKRLTLTFACMIPVFAAQAAEGDALESSLQGENITGSVEMTETASGMVHVVVRAEGVPEGVHGFHVHETGDCNIDTGFKSAGGHLARGKEHGIESSGGPHPGDFPNIHVGENGVLQAEFFTREFKLGETDADSLLDDDGSAVILHENADDYRSQPSGDAGDRIACGVLSPKG